MKFTAKDIDKIYEQTKPKQVDTLVRKQQKTYVPLPTKADKKEIVSNNLLSERGAWTNHINKVDKSIDVAKTNYKAGDLGEKESSAWAAYRAKQDAESKRQAEQATAERERFIQSNPNVGQGNLLTKNFAEYLPQMKNQISAGVGGMGNRALMGAGVGASTALIAGQLGPQALVPEEAVTVPAGALFGAVKGGQAGYMEGVGKYSYNQMAGSAYKQLISLGVPNEIAMKVSGDGAVVSSLIEAAGAGVDIATVGIGRLLNKGTKEVAAKTAQTMIKDALKAYGINIASEGIEEGLQEKVSIEGEKKALSQANMPRMATPQQDTQRIIDASKGGAAIALVGGGFNAAGNITTNLMANKNTLPVKKPTVQEIVQNNPIQEIKKPTVQEIIAKNPINEIEQSTLNGNNENNRVIKPTVAEIVKQNPIEETNDQLTSKLFTELGNEKPNAEIIKNIINNKNFEGRDGFIESFANPFPDYDYTDTTVQPTTNNNNQVEQTLEQGTNFAQNSNKSFTEQTRQLPIQNNNIVSNTQTQTINQLPIQNEQAQTDTVKLPSEINLPVKEIKSGIVQDESSKAYRRKDSKTHDTLDRLSKSVGVIIKFSPIVDNDANGLYNPQTNTIELSLNANNPIMTVAKHELTHVMQNKDSKLYKEYKDYIVKTKQKKGTHKTEYDNLVNLYEKHNLAYTEELINDEIVSNASAALFADRETIAEMINYNPTMAEKIHAFIKDIINKIKKVDSEYSLRELQKAEKLWSEMLNSAINTNTAMNKDTKYSLKDSQGNNLTEAQAEFFKDSKIKDRQGNLLVVYHQTTKENEQGIYEYGGFRTDKGKAILGDVRVPNGIFVKPDDKNIGVGSTDDNDISQIPMYANIKNPLRVKVAEEIQFRVKELSGNATYEKLFDYIIQTEMNNKKYKALIDKSSERMINTRRSEITQEERKIIIEESKKETDKIFIDWAKDNNELAAKTREIITNSLKNNGYDGVIIEEDKGSFGRETKTIIAFNSNQLKKVNNEQPTISNDIRFSLKDSKGNELTKEQQEYFKDSKVRGDKGNLLVVYHGTNEDFNIFDSDKTNYKQISEGLNFFTNKKDSYPDSATDYAREMTNKKGGKERIIEAYLNIKNPYIYYADNSYNSVAAYDKNHTTIQAEYLNGDYDGIIVKFKDENKGDDILYAVENSEQIKSIDNKKPTENPDIRFSLKQQETKFISNLSSNLGISKYADKQGLNNSVKELTNELRNGNTDSKKIDELFEKIFSDAVIVDDEFYNDYKDLKREIKNTRLFVSDKVKSEFPEYDEFRKSNFGKLTLTSDSSDSQIDSYYQELSGKYPQFFPEDVDNAQDQLWLIGEVQNSIVKVESKLTNKEEARAEFDKALDNFKNGLTIKPQNKKVKDALPAKRLPKLPTQSQKKNT